MKPPIWRRGHIVRRQKPDVSTVHAELIEAYRLDRVIAELPALLEMAVDLELRREDR